MKLLLGRHPERALSFADGNHDASLEGNQINNEGAKLLADALKANTTLQCLRQDARTFDYCGIMRDC